MTEKARYIDFYPDEFISGVSGKLTPEQAGVYWVICSLIYSKSGPIDDDHKWLSNIMGGVHWRTIRRILDTLINMGKIEARDGQLWVQRCRKELARTEQRISKASANGKQGGRPPNENKGLAKPDGLENEKLTINYQLPTNQLIKDKDTGVPLSKSANAPKKKRASKIPDDWTPNSTAINNGWKEGYSDDEINWLADGFRDYWRGEGKTKKDWDATFNNHLKSNIARNNVRARRIGNTGKQNTGNPSWGKVCAELSEELGAIDGSYAAGRTSEGDSEFAANDEGEGR